MSKRIKKKKAKKRMQTTLRVAPHVLASMHEAAAEHGMPLNQFLVHLFLSFRRDEYRLRDKPQWMPDA